MLGKTPESNATRDAVHVAIIAATATAQVSPGQLVNATGGDEAPFVGIVDPFIAGSISTGERFYICLFPETVTGMVHHWQHPAFDDTAAGINSGAPDELAELCVPDTSKEVSRLWLIDFAARHAFPFRSLMEEAESEGDRWVVAQGLDCHGVGDLDVSVDEFWRHVEAYTGKRIGDNQREGMGWSCSC